MLATHLFASIPVVDLATAQAWYERLVGGPPDLIPNDREAAWRIAETGWIYIVVDADRAGSAVHTALVDDLDGVLAGLADRGLTASPVETFGPGVRRATVVDPDGNRVSFGQPPD